METKTIQQSATFNALPMDVYEMMMDAKKHAALSGEPATISREVGGSFSAWGTHISGFNLALRPGQKIVQAWRALDWQQITTPSRFLSSTQLMVAPSSTLPKSVCPLTV